MNDKFYPFIDSILEDKAFNKKFNFLVENLLTSDMNGEEHFNKVKMYFYINDLKSTPSKTIGESAGVIIPVTDFFDKGFPLSGNKEESISSFKSTAVEMLAAILMQDSYNTLEGITIKCELKDADEMGYYTHYFNHFNFSVYF